MFLLQFDMSLERKNFYIAVSFVFRRKRMFLLQCDMF